MRKLLVLGVAVGLVAVLFQACRGVQGEVTGSDVASYHTPAPTAVATSPATSVPGGGTGGIATATPISSPVSTATSTPVASPTSVATAVAGSPTPIATSVVATGTPATAGVASATVTPSAGAAVSAKELALRQDMRKLLEDHITWTRLYIVSFAAGLPDQDVTVARLLQNQTDIGNAIKPYHGDAAGDKLTALLKDHIAGDVEVLKAAKAGDSTKLEAAKTKWYANGDEIATFLSTANPQNWPLADMKAEMKMHLDLTLSEASNRLQGKYADDIKDYDKVHEHILKLADTFSAGIVKQFPDKFK